MAETRRALLAAALSLGLAACASASAPMESPSPGTAIYGNTTVTTGGTVRVDTVYVSRR